MLVRQSGELDKGLTQIGQTAGETRLKVIGLRKDLFDMAKESGEKVDDLKQGFNNAVQAGLNFKEALPVLQATNKAMAVTGANADVLTSGLTVAATAFEFDLAKPNMALSLLDKMVVAGRLGNAELENLSGIFARVGVNAQTAGLGFEETLAFIEGLSLIERQPERLATLADSTLRLFTNVNYMKQAQKTTGIRFFDEKGEQRSPLKILDDIYKKYDAISSKEKKLLFLGLALKGTDIDTFKGTRTFLKGEMLSKVNDFSKIITEATGTIKRDMDAAMNNAVSQAGRLAAEMRRAADSFIQPLNAGITSAIKKLLDAKDKGGWGLSGEQLALGAGAAALLTYATYRVGGKAAKAVIGRIGGTAAGIAEGKAIEMATGVTPVFVVGGRLDGAGAVAPGTEAGTLMTILNATKKYGKYALPFIRRFGGPIAATWEAYNFLDYARQPQVRKESEERYRLAEMTDAHMRQGRSAAPWIKSDINIVMEDRRTTVTSNNMNTNVNMKVNSLPRGDFRH
jgi:TP901 family phage tail tape measure protein